MKSKVEALPTIDKFLIKSAHWIDNIDMYLGPFSEAAQISSSSFMNEIGMVSDIIQYGLFKLPFISLYLARTRDFSALANWVPRELIAIGAPYGGIVEIMRNYEKVVYENYNLK